MIQIYIDDTAQDDTEQERSRDDWEMDDPKMDDKDGTETGAMGMDEMKSIMGMIQTWMT